MPDEYTLALPRTASRNNTFETIMADALLDQHGGRGRLRLLSDEELFRARVALRREEVTADSWFYDLEPLVAVIRARAVSAAREAVEQEERRREQARARGVPRDPASGWVSEAVIDAIRDRLHPSALVQQWGIAEIRERPRGSGKWSGSCPFHADDSPSFYVYDGNDPHFHCFGCGAHGDVFDLARRHTGRNFQEVCEGLAGVAGVPWPMPTPPAPPARATPKKGGRVALSFDKKGA